MLVDPDLSVEMQEMLGDPAAAWWIVGSVEEEDLIDWLLSSVIEPILSSVFSSAERQGLKVSAMLGTELGATREYGGPGPEVEDYVWLSLKVRSTGDTGRWRICQVIEIADASEISIRAFEFGWHLEQWISESSKWWGQERHVHLPELGDP